MSDEQLLGPEEGVFNSLEEAVDFKNSMLTFVKSAGWLIIKQNLEHTIERVRDEFELVPVENLLEIGKSEFNKGDIMRARTTLRLPQELIEQAQDAIDYFESMAEADTSEDYETSEELIDD